MNKIELTKDDFSLLKAACGTHGAVATALGMTGRHYQRIRMGKHKNPWTLQAIAAAAARVRAGLPITPAQPQEASHV